MIGFFHKSVRLNYEQGFILYKLLVEIIFVTYLSSVKHKLTKFVNENSGEIIFLKIHNYVCNSFQLVKKI